MLYIFDKDQTLCPPVISQSTGKSHPPNRVAQQTYYGDVLPKTTLLKREGHQLAVASNQGGVAFGILMLGHAKELVEAAAVHIGADGWRVSPFHPKGKVAPYDVEHENRKPGPGMLLELMEEMGYRPEQTVMVGDFETDLEAAEAAGCLFQYAGAFFERNPGRVYIHWQGMMFATNHGMVNRETYVLPYGYAPVKNPLNEAETVQAMRVQIVGVDLETKVALVKTIQADARQQEFATLDKAVVDRLVKV